MKKILGIAAGAAIALSACGVEEAPQIIVPDIDPAEVESEAKATTINRLSADREEAKIFLKQMQEKDPAFVDAYYAINDSGKKVMMLVRDAGDGNVVTYPAFDASAVPSAGHGSSGQSATSSDSSVMPALLGGMLAGAVMGSLASNAMQGTTRSRSAQDEERRRSTSAYSSYVASSSQNTARAAATQRATVRAQARAASPSSPASSNSTASSSTARSGAFGSSSGGARGGGYAGSSGG